MEQMHSSCGVRSSVGGLKDMRFKPFSKATAPGSRERAGKVAQLKNWIFQAQKVLVFPDKLLAGATEVDLSWRSEKAGVWATQASSCEVSCPGSWALFLSLSLIASPGTGMMVG